ncbi:putative nitric oxide synthase isoform X2 [Malania oleifera]|uniref:putative nitric oxide synthase isoform X2 n=1 Tax=Malania oleifera TaxID=397392 RepID=UPI0025AE844B|nr:putative nitric oxide synthase isoform X2 [Malania oleifera]
MKYKLKTLKLKPSRDSRQQEPMAPRALSVFLSPLLLPHQLSNPNSSSLQIRQIKLAKPTTILCKATRQHTHYNAPSTPKTQSPSHSGCEPVPEGTGAAAPTPGEIFLESRQARAASAMVLSANKKKKKKRDKSSGSLKVSTAVSCCYGCGAPLQTKEAEAPGYVDLETYELKKKHHQLRTVLCGRCRLLSHGHMITAVGGNGGYSGGKQFASAEELREKLSHLRHEKALIVKLVDIVDFNGSFLARVRDLAGANPIILVVTKVDLLPRETDFNCIGDWVVEATMKKKLNVMSVHLTSSKSLVGIAGVVSEIQSEKKGRNVYILGSANVGKSAFISAILKLMAERDPVAEMARKYKPIQSAVPGTTLGPIQIDAFFGGGKLYDTPGVHLHHRQTVVVHSEDLPALALQSRLRGRTFPVASDEKTSSENGSNGLNGFSVFWGGLVRIDFLKVLPQTRLIFYGPKRLQIHMVPTVIADEFYKKEVGVSLTPPTGKQKADEWMGLETERQLQINFEGKDRPACDVAISGLGWIAIEPVNKSLAVPDSDLEDTTKELHLVVRVPKPVEIFVRPPLPVGKAGREWYQYRELTEKEMEARPKWFF